MSYRVSTQVYSGPFALLLQLVTRQKVDIGAISISEVAEQYLAEAERIEALEAAGWDPGAAPIVSVDHTAEGAAALESGKLYTDAELRKLLSGHLCRCTGYENILRAVKKTMYKRLGKPMPEAE